jgi:hypothetical protein
MEMKERQEQNQLLATVGPRPVEEIDGIPVEESGAVGAAGSMASSQTVATGKSVTSTPAGDGKKKKERGSTKKDLPEAVKNKLANTAAMMAVGGTMKSWMLPGASLSATTPKSGSGPQSMTQKVIPTATGPGVLSSTTVPAGYRQRGQKRVTIKDALFVAESFKHLRSSELLYKWWANVK